MQPDSIGDASQTTDDAGERYGPNLGAIADGRIRRGSRRRRVGCCGAMRICREPPAGSERRPF